MLRYRFGSSIYRCTTNSLKSSSILKSSQRFSSSKAEPFILPRVVIDLDAPNNPAVREYDEEIDNRPTPKQIRDENAYMEAQAQDWKVPVIEITPSTHFGRKKPEPLDLMYYALFGHPYGGTHLSKIIRSRRARLQRVFHANGIEYSETADMKIRKMTENWDFNGK